MNSPPIRVLCVTSHCDRPEAETFIGLKNSGFDLRVMCSSAAVHFERLVAAGLDVEPLDIKTKIDRAAIRSIRAALGSKRFDVLHLFNNRTVVNGLIASRDYPAKIITYRGIVGNESFVNPASWLRYLNPRVDRIVCVAEAVREYFLDMRLLGLRIPAAKLVRIYKGHDLDWYRAAPADLSRLGVPAGSFVVCCVANWRPRKGIEILIGALDHIPKDANIHLLLVGNMDSPRLLRQIKRSPFCDRIHLTGHREDSPAISAASSVAVLPSLKREGLPKGVIEAMAYGVPPIVTDSGGSPELVVNGESGIVVPSGDSKAIAQAILRLYESPALQQSMGRAARARIGQNFRIETTIEATAALYREVLGA
jgi:glycosyltransferase involved in cell wall biosynthesis